jgi:hypothetical protein
VTSRLGNAILRIDQKRGPVRSWRMGSAGGAGVDLLDFDIAICDLKTRS